MKQRCRRLEFAAAEYRSIAGDYKSGWEWTESGILYHVQVPFDCRMTFCPELYGGRMMVNGVGVEWPEEGLELEAGTYKIEAYQL